MPFQNPHFADSVYTTPRMSNKKKFGLRDWTSGIIDCGMGGILLISLLLKVAFSNVTGIIFGLGSIRQVFI